MKEDEKKKNRIKWENIFLFYLLWITNDIRMQINYRLLWINHWKVIEVFFAIEFNQFFTSKNGSFEKKILICGKRLYFSRKKRTELCQSEKRISHRICEARLARMITRKRKPFLSKREKNPRKIEIKWCVQ